MVARLDLLIKEFQQGEWRGSIFLGGLITLGLRLILGFVMAAVWLVADPWISAGGLELYTRQIGLELPASQLGQATLGVWLRWDALHYLRLAEFGYNGAGVGSSAFYPLFPLLAGGLSQLSGLSTLASSLLLSTLFCWAAFAALHRLAYVRVGPQVALWTCLALAVFPTSFFLIGPFTESLFLALTLGAFLAAYRRRWFLAALLASLGSLTRGPGLLTAIPLVWIGWQLWANDRQQPISPNLLPAGLAGLAALLPGFAFQWWRHAQGFPPLADTLRVYSRQEFVGPFRGISLALSQLLAGFEFIPLLEFLAALLFTILTIYMIVNQKLRRPEWILFQAANLILFISFNAFEASAWRSMARYVLSLFPGFLALGYWLSSTSKKARFWLMAASGGLLIAFSSLFALFWFFG